MSRRFNVFGLKRSGQHAIIEWIANHFQGPVCLANNCLAWPPNHKLTHVYHVDKHVVKEMRDAETKRGAEIYPVVRIYTAEDPHRKHQLRDLPLQGHTNVFILRSFWNNAASRMRMDDSHSAGWDSRFIDWWKDLAHLYLGQQVAWFLSGDSHFVVYDDWVTNVVLDAEVELDYRDALRLALCLSIGDEIAEYADMAAISTAHKGYAGNVGSSFHQWKDRGDENRRYELLLKAEDKRFWRLVRNEANEPVIESCRKLNLGVFGWTLNREGERVTLL